MNKERRVIIRIIALNIGRGKTRQEKAINIYKALAANPELFMKSLKDQ